MPNSDCQQQRAVYANQDNSQLHPQMDNYFMTGTGLKRSAENNKCNNGRGQGTKHKDLALAIEANKVSFHMKIEVTS